MKAIYLALAILLVLAGLFTGYVLWFPTSQVPQQFKYDVLKDTLTIVLAIIAVAIAVVGYLVYRIVFQSLERETVRRITAESMESRRWATRLATSVGYSLWKLGFREEAIRLTKEAHDKYAHPLDEREPENQLLIAMVRNNLAAYFAETQQEQDLARGYADFIYRKRHQFPQYSQLWEKTYKEVLQAFAEQEQSANRDMAED